MTYGERFPKGESKVIFFWEASEKRGEDHAFLKFTKKFSKSSLLTKITHFSDSKKQTCATKSGIQSKESRKD